MTWADVISDTGGDVLPPHHRGARQPLEPRTQREPVLQRPVVIRLLASRRKATENS